MIEPGVRLPWDGAKPEHLHDPTTGGIRQNNPHLLKQRDKVWDTIYEQFTEGDMAPWDCHGRDDNDVSKSLYAIS